MAKHAKRDEKKTPFYKTCLSFGALITFYALSFVELVPVYGPVTRFDIVFVVGLSMMVFGAALGGISWVARRSAKSADETSEPSSPPEPTS